MGVGGGFWDVLRPVARKEDLDCLRGKKLAIDLSYWIIQLLTAVKGIRIRKPHIRLLFFRTIHLVTKIGAFPIFVTDGEPPPLKLQVRLDRFSRISGLPANTPAEGTDCNIARNSLFTESIEECVELLKLLGLPVLRAKYEAEGLCAELDRQGLVNACVTPDSDALLYGAKCVIKNLQADLKDPLVESYTADDIQSILGLHREHLVALALLAGCDYDAHGVPGIGCHNAVRLIKMVPKHQVLDRLRMWGEGKFKFQPEINGLDRDVIDIEEEEEVETMLENLGKPVAKKTRHCSNCGHLGTKILHLKIGCEQCRLDCSATYIEQGCRPKLQGFKCTCEVCIKVAFRKKHMKQKGWQLKVCQKISETRGFPNEQIIQIYMSSEHGGLMEEIHNSFALTRKAPQIEALERFLEDRLYWDKIYIRQKALPLLSWFCLMEIAAMRRSASSGSVAPGGLINGLYAPHSIQRIKISCSKPFYMLRWRQIKDSTAQEDWLGLKCISCSQENKIDDDKLQETDEMETETLGNTTLFTTDEDMALVRDACPQLVDRFEQELDARRKSKKRKTKRLMGKSMSAKERQLNITSFFKLHNTLQGTNTINMTRDMAMFKKKIQKGVFIEESNSDMMQDKAMANKTQINEVISTEVTSTMHTMRDLVMDERTQTTDIVMDKRTQTTDIVTLKDANSSNTKGDMAIAVQRTPTTEVIVIEDTQTVEDSFLHPCKMRKLREQSPVNYVRPQLSPQVSSPPLRSPLDRQNLEHVSTRMDLDVSSPSSSLKEKDRSLCDPSLMDGRSVCVQRKLF